MMNILILAAGTRDKVIQYFRKAFQGQGIVVATDTSVIAPAIYEADKFYLVPSISDPGYIDIILDICVKERIAGVLSLIDPELTLLAQHRERFSAIGTTVIGSPSEQCDLAFDKMRMYHWLVEHGYRCAQTWDSREAFFGAVDRGEVSYPVFVKPICGSASIHINQVYNRETVDLLFMNEENLLIQEFLRGQEIGADVYVDIISHEVVSIFTKKKLKMRAGETDKAVSFKDPVLFELIRRFVTEAGFVGPVDIDLFLIDGEYYISEVNPRFGGGYPHAWECGADHMKMILNNLRGVTNEPCIGQYEDGLVMMKYNEVMIRRIGTQDV